MDSKAVAKAKSRLKLAESQLAEVEKSPNHIAFADHWYLFLIAAKNVYTCLEQGAKLTPQSRQWFGAKKNDRKTDPLLQYLFQARDDDEHGLDNTVDRVPGSLRLGNGRVKGTSSVVTIDNITITNGELTRLDVRGDGRPISIEMKPEHMRLATITGRGGVKYPPPEVHLGHKIDSNMPVPVGKLALAYLFALVSEAEQRCM